MASLLITLYFLIILKWLQKANLRCFSVIEAGRVGHLNPKNDLLNLNAYRIVFNKRI
ncbi:MAG: hypothetical protein WC364_06855 [Eubacteriales bacterium]